MYKIRDGVDIDDIVDGRKLLYLSKKIGVNRRTLGRLLNERKATYYSIVEKVVKYCRPDKTVDDYFIRVWKEG